jgi:4-hydroxybenzoate polyprenyltransferase
VQREKGSIRETKPPYPSVSLVWRSVSVHRLLSYVALTHPIPSAGTALAAVGAALPLAHGQVPARPLTILFLMMLLQQVAISLHNDWCDRDVDRLAKPGRAIPAGDLPAESVRRLAWGLAGSALLVSLLLGADALLLNALGLCAGFVYNAWLKRTSLSWLPFAVAFPLIPLFGMAALDRWPSLWWTMFAVPFPAIVAIHLADALPDLETDAAAGVRGLAQVLGARRTSVGAILLSFLGAAIVGALGVLRGEPAAVWGAAAGATIVLPAVFRPAWHRASVTVSAATIFLGWVLAVAAR